jgi:hypothetical protein
MEKFASRSADSTSLLTAHPPPPCLPTSSGLWFASIAYVLSCALWRIGLAGHTSDFAEGETIYTEDWHKFSVDGFRTSVDSMCRSDRGSSVFP